MFLKLIKKSLLVLAIAVFSLSSLADDMIKSEYIVSSGDNLISILKKNYVSSNDIQKLVYKTKDSKKLQKLKIGQKFTIYKKNNGSLEKLILDLDNVNVYIAVPNKDSFSIKKGKFKTNQINQYVIGDVKYSFNRTLIDMGLDKNQIKEFKNMFGSKIDFNKIKKGTKLVAVYPEHYNGNKIILKGDLISAEINYGDENLQVFSFNNYKGERAYYLKNGEPTSENIQRDPLKSYSRVSSEFSNGRKHPVLGYTRAHKGTDYAAKYGTPIFAASSGKISLKATQKGYGNVIVINHKEGYSTLYGHMSKFNKGIYSGKTVKKGDIVGFVGSTGISTGNHLHFEIRKNGKYLDPRRVNLPFGERIAKSDINKFKKFTQQHSDGIRLAKVINKRDGKLRVALRDQ